MPVATGYRVFRGPNQGFRYNAENRPVHAGVRYKPRLRDYLERDAGWYEQAISLLK